MKKPHLLLEMVMRQREPDNQEKSSKDQGVWFDNGMKPKGLEQLCQKALQMLS